MADYGKREHGGEPVLDFRWDPLVLAFNNKYSTTIRIELTGWWGGERPREVAVSFYQEGEAPPDGNTVRIQKGFGTFPLTGLLPGHHYHAVAYIRDRPPVEKLIPVPELPKPEVEARVKDLRVWAPGKDGKYVFSISVVSEKGTPVKGAMVRIFNETPKLVGQWLTNEQGTVDPPPSVDFSEPMMEFFIDVVGTELDCRRRLTGPTRTSQAPEVPEPPEEMLNQGWLRTFRWARDEVNRLIQERRRA